MAAEAPTGDESLGVFGLLSAWQGSGVDTSPMGDVDALGCLEHHILVWLDQDF